MALRDLVMCHNCLRLRRERDEARKQLKRSQKEADKLRAELGRAHRTINELPFGSSTPSAKRPVKPSATQENQARKGGASRGHKGAGRGPQNQRPRRPSEVVRVPELCPECSAKLGPASTRDRTLVGCEPAQAFTRTVRLQEAWCPCCRKTIRPQAPGAFPRLLLDNSCLAYVAVEHYVNGVTLGRLASITGIAKGTLTNAMHWLAKTLEPGYDTLKAQLRLAAVIWADETVWRNDGANGYAWMFRTLELVVYRFCNTRRGTIPEDVLGTDPLPGTLLTDRYGGYNGIRMARQFCYAHLLRDLQDLQKEFPDSDEVRQFVAELAPLLGAAMGLRREVRDLRAYRRRARRLMARIRSAIGHSARHPGVQSYQDIFRRHPDNLYHWVKNPEVPPDNNYAERSLRQTVIARKMSYGSQSQRGARTREILMSVVGTIAMRNDDPWAALRDALNRIAESPPAKRHIPKTLFPNALPQTESRQAAA